jgi:hypothetical protein
MRPPPRRTESRSHELITSVLGAALGASVGMAYGIPAAWGLPASSTKISIVLLGALLGVFLVKAASTVAWILRGTVRLKRAILTEHGLPYGGTKQLSTEVMTAWFAPRLRGGWELTPPLEFGVALVRHDGIAFLGESGIRFTIPRHKISKATVEHLHLAPPHISYLPEPLQLRLECDGSRVVSFNFFAGRFLPALRPKLATMAAAQLTS